MTQHQADLLIYAMDNPGWHTFVSRANNKAAARAIIRLMQLRLIEVVVHTPTHRQFRIRQSKGQNT